ncbi:hypothetical protein L915_13097, partial [Phytophthora nicotianae]
PRCSRCLRQRPAHNQTKDLVQDIDDLELLRLGP